MTNSSTSSCNYICIIHSDAFILGWYISYSCWIIRMDISLSDMPKSNFSFNSLWDLIKYFLFLLNILPDSLLTVYDLKFLSTDIICAGSHILVFMFWMRILSPMFNLLKDFADRSWNCFWACWRLDNSPLTLLNISEFNSLFVTGSFVCSLV